MSDNGEWIKNESPQDPQAFADVARALDGLGITKLSLCDTLMDIPHLVALLQNLPPEIKELNLGGTKLPPEAKAIMTQWAQVNQCKITVSDQAIKIPDGSKQGFHYEGFQCDGTPGHHQGAADVAIAEVLGDSSEAACTSGNSFEN